MKQPSPPYPPYPPLAPSTMIPVQKRISIQDIIEQISTDTLETTLKKIVATVDSLVMPMNKLHLQIEVSDTYGDSLSYGDDVVANLVYYVDEKNPNFAKANKWYKTAMVKHKADMKQYAKDLVKYEEDLKTWQAEQEIKQAKEKKRLYNRLKKEFGDA